MHMSVATKKASKEEKRKAELTPLVRDLFHDKPSMRYTDIKEMLLKNGGKTTAERRINEFLSLRLIQHSTAGLYISTV